MPISFSFDIEDKSLNTDDRMRINLAFRRFGWEPVGGTSWRYPALGRDSNTPDDWLNQIVPALYYFRTVVSAKGHNVPKYDLHTHSVSSYCQQRQIGARILKAEDLEFDVCNVGDATATKLSEPRLRRFVKDAEVSIL